MFVGGAVWVWSGASGEYMRKPVAEWSNNDVVEWVRGLGQWTQPNITQLFIKEVCTLWTLSCCQLSATIPWLQAITGSQLLKLDKVTLSSFGLLTEFRQETILDAIEMLRQNNYNIPRNLHEFAVSAQQYNICSKIKQLENPLWDNNNDLVHYNMANSSYNMHNFCTSFTTCTYRLQTGSTLSL